MYLFSFVILQYILFLRIIVTKKHYHDHDFPMPGYLIQPDGYMFVQNKGDQPVLKKDSGAGRLPATINWGAAHLHT